MRIKLSLALAVILAATGRPQSPLPASATHEVALNGHVFTLPKGFTIELAARAPLVDRPITAAFDEDGRLYVSDSSGSNEKVAIQLEKKPHRIVRLESTRGDGVFDRSTVFADQMMFPEGTMWYRGSLYVAAPPSIWKLTDTDGDGVADQRVEWFKGTTLTGCANDLHGPYLGPDGWIYWGKGAFAEQTYLRPGQKPFVTRASHVFRARPDGSGIEPVMTGGMDNAIDVAFTSAGERILSNTFLVHPGGGKRDGLLHAVYGGVYGKDHAPIHEHTRTGPELMPVLSHLGPAAPSGLTRYESDAFGPEYRDDFFCALFNMRKVTRHSLQPSGATFESRDTDFLVSNNLDFHPTDVIEDADGSLLVIDTGGWYKLCCPTSQLVKPDVLGAIYRVRRTDAPKIDDPRGRKIAWAKLAVNERIALLDDARPAVRWRAVESLATKDALAALADVVAGHSSDRARLHALWSLSRIEDRAAREAALPAIKDRDANVRCAALASLGAWRFGPAASRVEGCLRSENPHVRRVAAEALGRMGSGTSIPPLVKALSETDDPVLEHSIIHALIEIGDASHAWDEATATGDSRAVRGALIALDQTGSPKLSVALVVPYLDSPERRLREAAGWIVGRHLEWGAQLANEFRQRISKNEWNADERRDRMQQFGRLASSLAIQDLLAVSLKESPAATRFALGAMAQSNLKQMPTAWSRGLADVLSRGDADLIRDALSVLRAVPWPKPAPAELVDALKSVGQRSSLPSDLRLSALAVLPEGLGGMPDAQLVWLCGRLSKESSPTERTLSADVLAKSTLTLSQLRSVIDVLGDLGPMEINRVIEAFRASKDEDLGSRLIAALKASPAKASIRPDRLRAVVANYGPAVRTAADDFVTSLDAGAARQKETLEAMVSSLKPGEVRRGQAIFNSPKAACARCHTVGYVGGKVGPDLTRIGSIRSPRDLLEAIVFPSAGIVPGFEPVAVAMNDGKSHAGIIRKSDADAIVLMMGPDQELRLSRLDVAEITPSRVSLMPSGFDQQMSNQDLADLVAFLQACR